MLVFSLFRDVTGLTERSDRTAGLATAYKKTTGRAVRVPDSCFMVGMCGLVYFLLRPSRFFNLAFLRSRVFVCAFGPLG